MIFFPDVQQFTDMFFHHDGCNRIKINFYQSILYENLMLKVKKLYGFYYYSHKKAHMLAQVRKINEKQNSARADDIFCSSRDIFN